MCSLMMALTLGSTMLGAAGQMQQANAQAQADRYNAQVAEMNAKIADDRARDALQRGKQEEQRKRQEVSQVMGRQQAAFAANGVDLTFGSPLDTIIDTSVMGEMDALTIRANAYREEYDHRVQGANYRAEASLKRASASNAKTNGWMSAAGTVLGKAGSIGSYA